MSGTCKLMQSPSTQAALFMPQRLRGIYPRSACRGNVARNQRYHGQDGHRAQHSRWIEYTKAKELRLDKLYANSGENGPRHYANHDHDRGFAQDHLDDAAAARAQRHTNTDFV